MAASSAEHHGRPSAEQYDHLMEEIQAVLRLDEAPNNPAVLQFETPNNSNSATENPSTRATALETSQNLIHAIHAGDIAMVAMLLSQDDFDANFRDSEDSSLVRLAVKAGQVQAVKMLVDKGAKVMEDIRLTKEGPEDVDLGKQLEGRENCHYMSLIMEAVVGDSVCILDELIEAGCNVDYNDPVTYKTALHLAASYGSVKCVERLIAAGAYIDDLDSRNNTSLMMAVFENNAEVAELLLYSGSQVNVECALGHTPLIWAILLDHDIVDLLLYYGADTNMADALDKIPPLHFAVRRKNLECVEKVINCGAHVNAVDHEGKSALSLASHSYATAIVDTLLQHGANPSVKDTSDMTPLMEAFCEERYDIARLLLRHNACVDVTVPHSDLTLYQICLQTERQEAVKLMHEIGLPHPFKELRRIFNTAEVEPRQLYSLTNDLQFVDWLRAELFSPRSLNQQCLMVIRGAIGYGPSFKQKVQALPTAPRLRDIISFDYEGAV